MNNQKDHEIRPNIKLQNHRSACAIMSRMPTNKSISRFMSERGPKLLSTMIGIRPSWPVVLRDYLFLLQKGRLGVHDLDRCRGADCYLLRTHCEFFFSRRLFLGVWAGICWVSGGRSSRAEEKGELGAVGIV